MANMKISQGKRAVSVDRNNAVHSSGNPMNQKVMMRAQEGYNNWLNDTND
jgi:hypothetical protein